MPKLKKQEEGGETILDVSDFMSHQPSATITSNSHQSTKRQRKHKKSTTVSAEMISVPVVPTSAVLSSRKVTYVPVSKTADETEAQPTRSGRVVSKPARFLVTIANGQDLSFQQVGEGKNVTPN